MIIPKFWSEAKIKNRINGKQVTIKRFGWSDESELAAQTHANSRVEEAFKLYESGQEINRRELKTSYGGGDGLPIREEIVSRHNDVIITRNSYGALCLNTADVLFADVDFEVEPRQQDYQLAFVILMLLAASIAYLIGSLGAFIAIGIVSLLFLSTLAELIFKVAMKLTGGSKKRAKDKIDTFSKNNQDWHIRLYLTPAGYRLLVMHAVFEPDDSAVADFFTAINADNVYIFICKKQQCFRARVSPKPWRMGLKERLKPRPGVWPIASERMPARKKWVQNYEHLARNFASCRFEEQLGSNVVNRKAEHVQKLHDEMCNANSDLKLA